MRLPRNRRGTFPPHKREATAMTNAVFPTPGLPMSSGLFFNFRQSVSRTAVISRSRPTNGCEEDASDSWATSAQ